MGASQIGSFDTCERIPSCSPTLQQSFLNPVPVQRRKRRQTLLDSMAVGVGRQHGAKYRREAVCVERDQNDLSARNLPFDVRIIRPNLQILSSCSAYIALSLLGSQTEPL